MVNAHCERMCTYCISDPVTYGKLTLQWSHWRKGCLDNQKIPLLQANIEPEPVSKLPASGAHSSAQSLPDASLLLENITFTLFLGLFLPPCLCLSLTLFLSLPRSLYPPSPPLPFFILLSSYFFFERISLTMFLNLVSNFWAQVVFLHQPPKAGETASTYLL